MIEDLIDLIKIQSVWSYLSAERENGILLQSDMNCALQLFDLFLRHNQSILNQIIRIWS